MNTAEINTTCASHIGWALDKRLALDCVVRLRFVTGLNRISLVFSVEAMDGSKMLIVGLASERDRSNIVLQKADYSAGVDSLRREDR